MVGIIVAMPVELAPYLKNGYTEERIHGISFYRTKLNSVELTLCLSGVGKVNAGYAAAMMISTYNPELIINSGVSGGLGKLKTGKIILAESVVQHDVDTTALGDEPGYLCSLKLTNIPTSPFYNKLLRKNFKGMEYGIIACGDKFVADKQEVKRIRKTFDAVACDMESGAVAQACYIAGLPVVIIRCISDDAKNKAKVTYNELVETMSITAFEMVERVVETIG